MINFRSALLFVLAVLIVQVNMASAAGIPAERPISGVVKFDPARYSQNGFHQLDEIRLFSDIGPNIRTNQDNSGNSQNETTIARNPLNPFNLIGGANDYRNGEVDGGYYYTLNGGQTWGDGTLCCWPSLDAQGDPAMTCDADGNFYYAVISFDRYTPDNGIYVSKSTNGGANWGNPVPIIEHFGDPYAPFEDKEYIAADITNSPYRNNVYVSWTSFDFAYPILFSRSTNGGVSYSTPVDISGYDYCQGSVPAVGPNGEVYVAWLAYSSPSSIRLVKSTNGGASFGSEVIVANITEIPDPLPPTDFRDNSFPSIAVDISGKTYNGYIHIVWADYRNNDADIYYSRSTNGGTTWSTAVRVNDDPFGNGKDQFFPWISADPNGNVHLFFYDRRDASNNVNFHGYYTRSTNGGATWSANERVTSVSSNPYTDFGGQFIGDYNGITSVAHKAHPLWTDTRNGNQDIYTSKISWGTAPVASIGMMPNNTPITIPPGGGSFTYTGVLGNNTASPASVDVWLKLTLPNGTPYGPLLNYNNVPLAANQVLSVSGINQAVPSYAPAGAYTYWALVGDFPLTVMDSVGFRFTKQGVVNNAVNDQEWALSGWGFDSGPMDALLPEAIMLLDNYPNPFNATTTITYNLPISGDVDLEVYNLLGQKVTTLVDGRVEAGQHSVSWDAANYSSGIYFYKLSAGEKSYTKRLTLLK